MSIIVSRCVCCAFVGVWLMEGLISMWPSLVKQGTSHKALVSDFTCTVVGINMTNTYEMHSTRQDVMGLGITSYNNMSLTNWKFLRDYHWPQDKIPFSVTECKISCLTRATCSLFARAGHMRAPDLEDSKTNQIVILSHKVHQVLLLTENKTPWNETGFFSRLRTHTLWLRKCSWACRSGNCLDKNGNITFHCSLQGKRCIKCLTQNSCFTQSA